MGELRVIPGNGTKSIKSGKLKLNILTVRPHEYGVMDKYMVESTSEGTQRLNRIFNSLDGKIKVFAGRVQQTSMRGSLGSLASFYEEVSDRFGITTEIGMSDDLPQLYWIRFKVVDELSLIKQVNELDPSRDNVNVEVFLKYGRIPNNPAINVGLNFALGYMSRAYPGNQVMRAD